MTSKRGLKLAIFTALFVISIGLLGRPYFPLFNSSDLMTIALFVLIGGAYAAATIIVLFTDRATEFNGRILRLERLYQKFDRSSEQLVTKHQEIAPMRTFKNSLEIRDSESRLREEFQRLIPEESPPPKEEISNFSQQIESD